MPIVRDRYRKAVIDTSPLITALTLEFIEKMPRAEVSILNRSPLQSYLASDPAKQSRFRLLLRSIGELLITSHAVGEIKSGGHCPKDFHSDYWEICLGFFTEYRINEKLITLSELNTSEGLKQILCNHGPTDAGLVALASREQCLLLTDDDRLYQWLGAFPHLDIKLVRNEIGD